MRLSDENLFLPMYKTLQKTFPCNTTIWEDIPLLSLYLLHLQILRKLEAFSPSIDLCRIDHMLHTGPDMACTFFTARGWQRSSTCLTLPPISVVVP